MSEQKMHNLLMSAGRLFHRLGVGVEKDLSPSVLKDLHVGFVTCIK